MPAVHPEMVAVAVAAAIHVHQVRDNVAGSIWYFLC